MLCLCLPTCCMPRLSRTSFINSGPFPFSWAALPGSFLKPREASALGLVDEVVPKEQLMSAAEKILRSGLRLPDAGRIGTKTTIRGSLSRRWEGGCVQEAEAAWAMLSDPATVKMLGAVLKSLSRSKNNSRSKM